MRPSERFGAVLWVFVPSACCEALRARPVPAGADVPRRACGVCVRVLSRPPMARQDLGGVRMFTLLFMDEMLTYLRACTIIVQPEVAGQLCTMLCISRPRAAIPGIPARALQSSPSALDSH